MYIMGRICKVMKPIVVYRLSVNFCFENYFMPLKVLIWRLSSKLPIAIPVHSVVYEATLFF